MSCLCLCIYFLCRRATLYPSPRWCTFTLSFIQTKKKYLFFLVYVYVFILCRCATLYPSPRRCTFTFSYIQTKKKYLFFSCLCLCIYVYVFILCRCATLYPSPRQTTRVLLRFCKFKKKKKKKTHGNMGKNVKSYATIPTLHSPGKGGKPHSKKSQSIGQTKHDSGCTHFSFPHLLKLHVKLQISFLI